MDDLTKANTAKVVKYPRKEVNTMKALSKLTTIHFPTKKSAKEYGRPFIEAGMVARVRPDEGGSVYGVKFPWVLRIYKVNEPVKKAKASKANGGLKATDKRLKSNRKAKKTKVTRVPATKPGKVEKSKPKSKTHPKKV